MGIQFTNKVSRKDALALYRAKLVDGFMKIPSITQKNLVIDKNI